MAGGHHAALLHRVVQQGERGSRAVGAADLQSHGFENARHTVAHRRGRSEREIDDAERHAEPPGRLPRDELTHARDLKRRALDRLGHDVKALALALLQRLIDAGAGNADVHRALGLARAVERARHKWVILHRVAENDELRARESVRIGGERGALFDNAAHLRHSVHVDARARRADVHARADALGACKRLGNGGDETAVAGREALLHKDGKAADVVHADLARGAVHCHRDGDKVIPAPARDERHGRNGHALIHDGDAEFALDGLAHGDKVVRLAADLFVDLIRGSLDIAGGAVEKAQPQRDRAHVKVLLLDHPDGLDDLVGIEEIAHGALLRSGAWRRKYPAAARAPQARAPRRRSEDAARAYRTAFRTRQDRRA